MAIPVWDQEFKYEQTIEVAIDLSTCHVNRISNESLRSALKTALANRDYASLVSWSFDYGAAYSASDVLEARQVVGFFQKLEPLELGLDKEAAARKKFLESEVLCRETNTVFNLWSAGKFNFPRGVDGILHAAQRKIAKVLGRVPALSELDYTFGPGATTSVPRRTSCSRTKLSSKFSCSSNFIEILPTFLEQVPAWTAAQAEETYVELEDEVLWDPIRDKNDEYLHDLDMQDLLGGDDAERYAVKHRSTLVERFTVEISDGRIAFVPKNAKTYRTVLTEPTLNTVVQGGYGRHIAARLRRVGQDIRDQERNKALARVGSLTGDLATLDLSSASDTISTELVAHLLPYEWFSALDSCRTKTASDGDVTLSFEKFSSMGNGFTFPLQTLIFWALASSCSETNAGDVSVYGDDIICHVDAVPEIFRVFRCCGFLLNTEKSFWSGPFRESCGADYYYGIDVRPFYLKEHFSFEKLFILHNRYYRNFDSEMVAKVLDYIPETLRRFGPDGYGDGHLLGDWIRKPYGREHGYGGYLFSTYKKLGDYHTRCLPGDRALPAYSIYVKSFVDDNLNDNLVTGANILHPSTWVECEEWGPKTNALTFNKRGVLRDPLPGSIGYKEIQIYTLTYA